MNLNLPHLSRRTILVTFLLFNATIFLFINRFLSLHGQFRLQNFININFIYSSNDDLTEGNGNDNSETIYNTLPMEKGAVCNIPKLDPFDLKALKLIHDDEKGKEPPKCLDKSSLVKFVVEGPYLIRVNPGMEFWNHVSCCYIGYYGPGLVKTETTVCYPLSTPKIYIPSQYDYINVKCSTKGSRDKIEYQDQFEFFKLNQTLQRYKHKQQFQLAMKDLSEKPNILFMGFDSISHVNFLRQFPNTRQYLLQNLNAIEFNGRNKISVATQGNLLSMLTGCTLNPESSYPMETYCVPVWRNHFKGYTTIRAEDDFGSQHHFFPTLHGWNESHSFVDYLNWFSYLKVMKNLNKAKANQFNYGCFDYQWVQNLLMDRIYNVAEAFDAEKQPYFHFTWTASTAHDIIGYARYLDEPVFNLLRKLHTSGFLNNTILMLVSDHGVGYGTYSRETNEGSIEARMPFLYIVFPEWFSRKYSKAIANMKINSMRLTTPYDLYETLVDLSDLDRITDFQLLKSMSGNKKKYDIQSISKGKIYKKIKKEKSRRWTGISLFQEVPVNRTCETAGIPEEWCICWIKSSIPHPDTIPELHIGASVALTELNYKLASFPACNQLQLKEIQVGRKISTKLFDKTSYEIVFKTLPGEALFEITIAVLDNGNEYKLVGDIVRANPYGQRGACLDIEYYSKNISVPYLVNSACYCR